MPTQQCATTVSIEATIIGSRYHLCLSRIDVVSIGHMSKVLGWMALLHYYSRIKKEYITCLVIINNERIPSQKQYYTK